MIKLSKGDCVDTHGLTQDQRNEIIDYFLDCGCPCSWTDNPHGDIYSRFIFWSKSSNYLNGNDWFDRVMDYTMFDGADLLAELTSQDNDSDGVVQINRNVVFTDYNSNHLPGAMEITITDNEEVTVCVDKVIAYDNVDSKKNIEETVDILKVWRSIIDSAIKELEE